MAERIVVWTETAAKQRRLIFEYWTKRNGSPKYAKKLLRHISARTRTIASHPFAYKEAEFPDTRESAMGHFSIYYKVMPKKIIITAFWDNRQDPKKLLSLLNDG